jgi:PAS domain S-box-containing protein
MNEYGSDSPGPIQILIAEDSPTQAAQLEYHLTSEGYQVIAAANGREALAAAGRHKPTLVITDVVMPEMDGYMLCKSLKAQPQLKDVPVILLTSLSSPQDVLQGLECGADNFIRKPYNPQYLLSQVEYILTTLSLRRNHRTQAGVQLHFGGRSYSINAERQQILDLLISTYEGAIQIHQELAANQLELARERDLMYNLMENVPDFIYFKDINGGFTRVNRAFESALGVELPASVLGKTDFDFFPMEYAIEAAADERKILESGVPLVAKPELVQKPDGEKLWLSTTKMAIRDIGGSSTGTFGVSRDITQSKRDEEEIRRAKEELEERVRSRTSELASAYHRLEQELIEKERAQQLERETQARFRFLFANNPLPMWVYQKGTGRFLEVNEAAVSHYRYSCDEFARLRVQDLIHEGKAGVEGAVEMKHRVKDGRIIDVHITGHAIKWLGQDAMLEVAQDLTEQKRLQREFLQAQKMEAIGSLAAGVAHDFNNLLTIITGYSETIMDRLPPEDPARDEVAEISRAGERAATLTRQLLAFSRKQVTQPKILNLNSIVVEMTRMLHRLIGEDVELTTQLEPSLGNVKTDAGQMEQVIMNLAVNARDAMPHGGVLTIATYNLTVDAADAIHRRARLGAGPYVALSVKDTGVGMDEPTQARIFEPFFTTKQIGKGTGLGLSTVAGIVERSGGRIVVQSDPGQGALFTVYLPQAAGEVAAVRKMAAVESWRSSATILIVEDESSLRALESRLLERVGCRVLIASNGQAAIQMVESYSGKIDLLITDVVMPGMSGTDLARRVAQLQPNLGVLFTSGYTANSAALEGILAKGAEFLPKPFAPAAFVQRVKQLVEPAGRGEGAPA